MNAFRTGAAIGSVALAALLLLGLPSQAAELPMGEPERAGFSADRLQRVTDMLQDRIDAGTFPGAILTIARQGEIVYQETLGRRRPEGPEMTADTIFRIYSMTKQLTSVAAMMLVEEGRLTLADPVARYLPEYSELQVAIDPPAGGGAVTMEAAVRPMAVRDLLLHTSGLTYGYFGAGAARQAYNEAGIGDLSWTNEEFARRLAEMPLEHQPGTVWEYSQSTDLLGRVIEVVSGQTLGTFLQERILGPLDMTETAFHVADPAKADRLAQPFEADSRIGTIPLFDPMQAQAFESGGGGLMSTTRDYTRFLQMLLNGGELHGARLLSPKTVQFMTTDHLGDRIRPGKYYLPGPGYGFGLGFAVRTSEGLALTAGNVGEYYGGGAAGTYFWVDPAEEMFVVFMMQAPQHRVPMRTVLRDMIYGAIVDEPGAMSDTEE